MSTPNPDKAHIIRLVNRLLDRSGLTIDQVVARMQVHGCDVTRTTFENRFTTRIEQRPNVDPGWTLALIAAFTQRLANGERCTAYEAMELARLTRLPIDRFKEFKPFFPEAEFAAAYRQVAPSLGLILQEKARPGIAYSPEAFECLLTCRPEDEASVNELASRLTAAGLRLWPEVGHISAAGVWPLGLDQALAASHTWLLCIGPGMTDAPTLAGLPEPPTAGVTLILVLLPGARQGMRSRLPRWLQRLPWVEFHEGLDDKVALSRLVAAIKVAIPPDALAQGKVRDARCPYRGLQVFDEEHAEFFFGREADVGWLLEALRDSRFLAVVGPSGSGKSSLVRAGLIPALRRGDFQRRGDPFPEGDLGAWSPDPTRLSGPNSTEINSKDWLIQVFQPGRRPLDSLAFALLKCNQGTLSQNLGTLVEELRADENGLGRLTQEILAHATHTTHLALVVDQFEELFTLCEADAARRAFIANLLHAASTPGGQAVVILTMRADFYSQAATYPDLAVHLADNQVLVSPMTGVELTRAITLPAQKVGLSFEPGLVDRLLADTEGEPGALPLLQHALLELWERRQNGRLTFAAYYAIGGVQGALAQRAEGLLAEFTPDQQAHVRWVMLRLARLGEGTADTRRRATMTELARTPEEEAAVRAVVAKLADARLVTTSCDLETGEETVEVAHEALIRGWPALQSWLAEDREALRLHQRLAEAALEWARNSRDESYLYRGARLAAAEEWAATHAGDLNQLERDFLSASLTARDAETTAREGRRRRVVLALAAGLIVTFGLALLALSQWQQVEKQRRLTLSRQLAAQAGEYVDDQLDLALLLSAEAFQIADTVEARSGLLAALTASPYMKTYLRGHTNWVWSVAFSPDGKTLASGGADGTIILWDVATGQPSGPPLTGHSDWVRSIAFSPDGGTLASGSADGTLILWDATTGQPLGPPLVGHNGFITEVAFSPDGRMLASGSADGTLILWDVASGQPLGDPLVGHTSFVLSLAFSPDTPEGTGGRILASSGADGSVILWDISTGLKPGATGREPDRDQPLAYALTGHHGAVFSVAFSPDGQALALGGEDQTIILWDVAARQPLGQPLTGHEGPVSSIAFSPDGRALVSSSEDKTVILWDLETGQPLDRSFTGHSDRVLDVAFSPDGHTLASGSADETVILWDVSTQSLGHPLAGHTLWVNNLAFSPDGRRLASASSDGTIILWDAANHQPLGPPLVGHKSDVNEVAFSPDNQLLASGGLDGAIILWDVSTLQPIGSALIGHQNAAVTGLAFSPDGRIFASAGEDDTIVLWDVASRQSTGPAITSSPYNVKDMAFSPDGRILAFSGHDHTIILWDVAAHQPLGPPLIGQAAGVLSLAFSPDGGTLASGSHDGTIVLWDVAARQPIRQPLVGHTNFVMSLAFSPDGQALVSGGQDGALILWDVTTHRLLGTLLSRPDPVRSVDFSPDGQMLASVSSNDGVITLWDADPMSWQERACRMAARNLTRQEWERYLGEEPYRLTCPQSPPPAVEVETGVISSAPASRLAPSTSGVANNFSTAPVAITEAFDSSQGFIQTSPNVYINDGQVVWDFQLSGGEQYVYRSIPPFSGDVRLLAQGRVNSWNGNCTVKAGIGEKPGSGLSINFGWTGGGCPTNGPLVDASGVSLDKGESYCEFTGNWLWVEESTPYTAELTLLDGAAVLTVEGVGDVSGTGTYEGPYTTLWVGNVGNGDWPECSGTISSVIVQPLD